ncbi:MAG: RNA polymerase sigma factor [Alphaproteobacteria bacterium]|nr:RNA polymerase sigma factor [Alphaproteobacteria bacterium]
MVLIGEPSPAILAPREIRIGLVPPAVAGVGEGRAQAAPAQVRGMDDDELMARIAEGDHTAYGVVVKRHVNRLIAVAQRILADRTEAEDVAQEALLRVWRHAAEWRPGAARISTWLYRVAVNLCLDRKRRPQAAPLEAAGDPVDPSPDAFAAIYRDEVTALVAKETAKLPDRQRAALALCYYEGMSNAEAAEILGVSIGALESLLVRARRTLAERLGPVLRPAKESDNAS